MALGLIINAQANDTYVETDKKDFFKIQNADREADAWGVCRATYKIMSEIIRSEAPQQAKKMNNYGNGARLAVIMAHVNDGIQDPDITPKKFATLWDTSKMLGDSIPDAAQAIILADAEDKISNKNQESFRLKLTRTLNICLENLDNQQVYIDAWRSMMKTGILSSK